MVKFYTRPSESRLFDPERRFKTWKIIGLCAGTIAAVIGAVNLCLPYLTAPQDIGTLRNDVSIIRADLTKLADGYSQRTVILESMDKRLNTLNARLDSIDRSLAALNRNQSLSAEPFYMATAANETAAANK